MLAVDYVIVGQGLAGTCLALELIARNKKLLVVDQFYSNSSSRIAAGVYNPITGRTNQPTWRAKEIFSHLTEYYRSKETLLKTEFLYPLTIYRPYLNANEQNKWPTESNEWIQNQYQRPQFDSIVNDYGGIELKNSGYIDTMNFLDAARAFIISHAEYLNEAIDFSKLDVSNQIHYKNYSSEKLIFCEGVGVLNNPYFNWLPIRKLKGEMILVDSDLPNNHIINRGVFSLPIKGKFLIGSTYVHDETEGNTLDGINDALARAGKLFKSELNIVEKIWGHRPTSRDRRPILGQHPKHQKINVFNGLGTKGVSLAPFFAVHFANWLEGKTELDKEVNIERFYSLSFKSI